MTKPTPAKRPFRLIRFLYIRWRPLAQIYVLSKVGFPFMPPAPHNSTMRQLRARTRRAIYSHQPPVKCWLARATMTLTWPIGAVVDTLYQLRVLPDTRLSTKLRYSKEMLVLALRENVPPFEYIAYRLYEPARRNRISDYLYNTEQHLLRQLNDHNGANNDDVQDKGRFADICLQHDLPCIPTLAVYQNGKQREPDAPFLPQQDCLWVKDLAGKQGSGAGQWWRTGENYRDASSQIQTPEYLVASWQTRACLVQPCLFNHPRLEGLTDGELLAFRLITGIDREGKAHHITRQLCIPWGGKSNRANFVLCTLAADGSIARAFIGGGTQPVERHPRTGANLADITVPYWREAQELVQHAHQRAFPRFVFLGWDVAITAAGPVLIETNSGPGLFHHQLLDDIPLGQTNFATIAAQYFDNLPERGR